MNNIFLTSSFKKLACLSIVLSVFYSCTQLFYINNTLPIDLTMPLAIVKAISIVLIAVLVRFFNLKDKVFVNLLFTALIFHSVGDIVIDMTSSVIYPIPFFLMGHLLYVIILIRTLKFNYYNLALLELGSELRLKDTKKPNWSKTLKCILLITIAVLYTYFSELFLARVHGDELYYAIAAYILVLTLLAVLTLFHPACFKWLLIGVSLYIISDCLVAYNQLVTSIPIAKHLAWPLYYFAQALIVTALINNQIEHEI